MQRTGERTSSSPPSEAARTAVFAVRTSGVHRLCRLLVLAITLVPSTAAAANREHQQMMADFRMLQEQTQQLQVSLNALAEVLKTVTGRLDDQAGVVRKAFADQRVLADALSADVRIIREKLDDNNVRVSSLGQELEALRTTLATPPPPPPAVPDDLTGLSPDGLPQAAPAPALSTAGLSPQRLWDSAHADYTAGQWTLAVLGYEQFIKAFPKSEQADDAQFYIGETYTLDGKFTDAVAAYDKVISNYPTGDAVAGAYYKRGLALARLGETDRARESWQLAADKFPGTDVGNLAKQALARQTRPPAR